VEIGSADELVKANSLTSTRRAPRLAASEACRSASPASQHCPFSAGLICRTYRVAPVWQSKRYGYTEGKGTEQPVVFAPSQEQVPQDGMENRQPKA
jgi:hypothetical protein